jgi:microcystin degradation protein MlrC
VLDVLVFGGFPYADTAATGASVFVLTDAGLDPHGEQATAAAQLLMKRIRELAPEFAVRLPTPESAVAAALRSSQPGLLAVTDPGDNPLSGGGGDTPGLFRALLAADPRVPCVFASFASPAAVGAARSAGIGRAIEVTLGGRFGSHFGAGVPVRATVEHLTDGVFRNEGPMEAGLERRCGGTAVLKVEGPASLRVIVTEQVVAADDPAFYKLNGIDLGTIRLLCVKAKNHFRAAFAKRCSEIIDCSAPGPASV